VFLLSEIETSPLGINTLMLMFTSPWIPLVSQLLRVLPQLQENPSHLADK